MKFAIIGSALSGNKGAAAMLESSLQTLSQKYPGAQFTLLSMYPAEDNRLNEYPNLEVLRVGSWWLGLVLNPAALLYKLVPPLRTTLLNRIPQLKCIAESDALLDQGGITFSDGREVFLLYNVASILPALFLKTKVIKCAQALGPFKNPINRLVSKMILPHLTLIIARGKATYDHLMQLKLKNVVLGTDYAFSLALTKTARAQAAALLEGAMPGLEKSGKTIVGISPSVVVQKKCEKKGINYVGLMHWLVDELIKRGYVVVLVPHSARTGEDKLHNNDLPLCRTIFSSVKAKQHCIFIDQEVSSQVLRAVIGRCDLFIACRFHAMVSALAMGVPTLVLGWSHKYAEVLEQFGVREFGVDSSNLKPSTLMSKFGELAAQREKIARQLTDAMPRVRQRSLQHVDFIEQALKR